MKSVALTGSFASGKSFVLAYIKKLGYKTFSCDDYVGQLYNDANVQKELLEKIEGLGKNRIRNPGKEIFDKKRLAGIIYDNDLERKKLEDYIHPKVREGIDNFKKEYSGEKLLFMEVPLLFETGFNKHFDYSICIYCNEKNRMKRARERHLFNSEIYDRIKKIQWAPEKKRKLSDFRINTDGELAEIQNQVNIVIDRLMEIYGD